MAYYAPQRYKKSLYFTTQTFPCTKIITSKTSRVHLLNPLLYETDAKVRKKSVFHNTDFFAKIHFVMKKTNKIFATVYLQCKVKQIIRNANTYVGFYFSAIPYADLYAQ